MDINIGPVKMIQPLQKPEVQVKTEGLVSGEGFGEFLKKALEEVNTLQGVSADAKTKLVTGQVEDIHQVILAGEKASLAFQLTVQIRNKVIEAYQEVMRMQV